MEAEKVMASINQGGYERSRTRRQYRQSIRATMADEGVAEVYHADKGQEEAIRFRERTACRRAGKSYIARWNIWENHIMIDCVGASSSVLTSRDATVSWRAVYSASMM